MVDMWYLFTIVELQSQPTPKRVTWL